MNPIKKWLFPVLTALIVAGAAVLPPRISQLRDARQLGQVHAEALEADSLPAVSSSTLLDRIILYADQSSSTHPVLSSRVFGGWGKENPFQEQEPLLQATRELLTGAGVLPEYFFEEKPLERQVEARLLLWDPAASDTFQEPAVFWGLDWEYFTELHSRSLKVYLDAETGLPIYLCVYDTNMSQWLAYDGDRLRELAERYFGLLGLEVRQADLGWEPSVIQMELRYDVAGSDMRFFVIRAPTTLTIEPDSNWRLRADSGVYDG